MEEFEIKIDYDKEQIIKLIKELIDANVVEVRESEFQSSKLGSQTPEMLSRVLESYLYVKPTIEVFCKTMKSKTISVNLKIDPDMNWRG